MTRIIYYACETIAMFVKVWLCLGMVAAVSRPRWSKRTEEIVKVSVTLLWAVQNSYNIFMEENVHGPVVSNIMLLFVAIMIVLVMKALYKQRWQYIFNIVFLFLITVTLMDFFALLLIYLVLDLLGYRFVGFVSHTLTRGIYLLIFSVACMWIGKDIQERLKRTSIQKYHAWITLSILPLSIFLILTQNIYLLGRFDPASDVSIAEILGLWRVFGLFAFAATLLFIAYHVRQKDSEERCLQQLKLHMLESNYQSLMQVYEEKAILLHDVKNHIQMVREMVEQDEKDEVLMYLDTMSVRLLRNKHRDLTNHKLLNLILNMKFHEAEAAGISVEYEFDDMNELQLKPMEICALFTNLLDNAIEANEKLAKGMSRYLHMSCTRKNNILLLNLSNPVGEDVKMVDGELPFTIKEDKQFHGFGMRSVRQILETYEGHMRIDVENGEFLLTAYLQGFHNEEI